MLKMKCQESHARTVSVNGDPNLPFPCTIRSSFELYIASCADKDGCVSMPHILGSSLNNGDLTDRS